MLAALLLPFFFVNGPAIVADNGNAANSAVTADVEPKKPVHVDVPKEFQYPTPPPAPWPSSQSTAEENVVPKHVQYPTPPPQVFVPEADQRMAEAYLMQRRFVLRSYYLTPSNNTIISVPPGSKRSGFSPPDDTRIVRNGNLFRVKGWFQYHPGIKIGYDGAGVREDDLVHIDYLCEMRYDADLDVWHLVGRVEEIR